MATTMVLSTYSSVRTARILHNNITKSHFNRKPTQYFEYYVATITPSQTSSQQLIIQYYLPTQREKYFYETTAIFHDQNYHYNNDYQTQWF